MRTIIKFFPIILLPVALVTLSYAFWKEWIMRESYFHFSAAILISIHLLWILLEMNVTYRTSNECPSYSDHGSLIFYGLARVITIGVALYAGDAYWSQWHDLLLVPIILFIFGIVFRLLAIKELGDLYSHQVRVKEKHQIIQDGPYSVVRHPAYSGMLMAELGFIIYFLNLPGLMTFFCLFLPSVIYRIKIEEKVLEDTLVGYSQYAKKHKRIIPKIW